MRKIKAIIDLQFGSTGKGLIAGYLAARDNPDTVVTAWAANAGHTYIDREGHKYVHTMLANGIVSNGLQRILIGPGSLINPEALLSELAGAQSHHYRHMEILIHPHAAVISQRHIDEEAGPMTAIGSTKKGVGAAMIERIRRDPINNNVACNAMKDHPLSTCVVTVDQYNAALDMAKVIQVEGAQGYSLSLYHGMYPYTTSRDVTTAQLFADCGIPIGWIKDAEVIGTVRTFPIRVANRFDDEGKQVGFSGGHYPDQVELEWKELGMEPELTTVTKLPRRIFTLSEIQLAEAMRQCSVDSLFVNFVNYCRSELELKMILTAIRNVAINNYAGIKYLGFGPTDRDVMELAWDDNFSDVLPRWEQTAVVRQGSTGRATRGPSLGLNGQAAI